MWIGRGGLQVLSAMPLLLMMGLYGVTIYSLIAVARWANASRRERTAYYKSETITKITESPAAGSSTAALEFIREEEKKAARRRREGLKLGGIITIASGLGVMIFIRAIYRGQEPVYLVGLIPSLIGIAVLGYAYLLAPKE